MAETSLGLIVPLSQSFDVEAVARLAESRVISSVWVRDLPAVAVGDDDTGQRSDPWWYLGRLWGAGARLDHIGTASVILGTRHPMVIARAAAGAQIDSDGRFVLGVGSGGKPAMNQALGISGRTHAEFAADWAELRDALRPTTTCSVSLGTPVGYQPPPVYLATSDLARWEAIAGDADGWQTFLTGDRERLRTDHQRVCAIRGADTDVDLRLDVHLVYEDLAGPQPEFTNASRGRVRCSAAQLPKLICPWLGAPVRRILLRLTGHDPEAALRHLSDHWPR